MIPSIATEPCPWCHGRGQIPNSKNWVAQGYVEAHCWHCWDGRVKVGEYLCAMEDGNCEGNLRIKPKNRYDPPMHDDPCLCGFHSAEPAPKILP